MTDILERLDDMFSRFAAESHDDAARRRVQTAKDAAEEIKELRTALQRPYITSELAWENRIEGIAQTIEDKIGSCQKSQVEAYLKAADIVRKSKETNQ
jgi:hypothetical protein